MEAGIFSYIRYSFIFFIFFSLDLFGRVIASDVSSVDPLPPFRASIKDGYAVLSSDGKGLRKVLKSLTAGMSVGVIYEFQINFNYLIDLFKNFTSSLVNILMLSFCDICDK